MIPDHTWTDQQWKTHHREYKRRIEFVGFEPLTSGNVFEFFRLYMIKKNPHVIGFALKVRYDKSASVSHSAPFGALQNWRHVSTLPTGYPGFTGRIWYCLDSKKVENYGLSHPYEGSGLHSGTGGYGSYDGPWDLLYRTHFLLKNHECNEFEKHNPRMMRGRDHMAKAYQYAFSKIGPEPKIYSYDCRWYLIDFPKVAHELGKTQTMETLAGNFRDLDIRHHDVWTGDLLSERNDELQKMYQELSAQYS